jgi:4'-phosphopantetheinyl transferase
LRETLASYLGCEPLDVVFSYGPHGKPAVENNAGLQFNLSHSGDWTLIGVSREIEIGVDIERIRENVDIAALLRRVGETDVPDAARASPLQLYRRWAGREAASKAMGAPLFARPDARVCIAEIDAPAGYAAALGMVDFWPEAIYRGTR